MTDLRRPFAGAIQHIAPVDLKSLNRASKSSEWKPVTSTTLPGLRRVRGGTFPGSLCYNFKKVDYVSHRVLPAVIGDKYPKTAVKFARVSPRWGATIKHKREDRVISPPWAAGQLKLDPVSSNKYAVQKGERKLGTIKVSNKGNVNLRLQNRYKNLGYGVESLNLIEKKHPEVAHQIRTQRKTIEKPWNRKVPLPDPFKRSRG